MKIFYDHQIFTAQVYGGVSRYFYEVMDCFSKDAEITFKLPLMLSNNHYIENSSFFNHKTFLKKIHFKWEQKLLNIYNRNRSIEMLKKQDFDIFHPTYYDPYFLDYIKNKPFVLTIHDMIHEVFSEIYHKGDSNIKWKKLLAAKAAKIIAVSENTKRDIIKFFNIDGHKIEVIYHGNSLNAAQRLETYDMKLPGTYLFYIGKRHLYKNFDTFIKSITQLLIKDKALNIVCAGGEKMGINEMKFLKESGIGNRVYHYQIINDNILVYLYKNATALVYPSLYEGFGIPILEAFSCGCPVLLSNASSFPEIAGDAALYFDPKDMHSINEAVKDILYNENLRNKLKVKGFEQLKNFSWEKTANKTKSVYKSIL